MYYNPRFLREAGADDFGGPSLAEITNADGTSPGDHDDPSKNSDGTDKGDGITPLVPGLNAPAADPNKPADDKGTPADDKDKKPEGDDKGDDKDKGDNKGDAGDDTPEEVTPEIFFGTVEKLTGVKVEVEYPEGVDPLSPDGIAVRDKALIQYGAQNFETHLQTKDPRAYAYMIHRSNGGSDDDFMGDHKVGFVLPSVPELEASAELQEKVYRQMLLRDGRDADEVTALVEAAIKANKLLERSKSAHTNITTSDTKALESVKLAAQKEEEEYTRNEQNFIKNIDQAIASNLSYVVPEAQRQDFRNFVINSVQYTADKKFVLVQEIDENTMAKKLDSLLFQYMKGDLSTVLKRQVKTEAAHKLRLGMQKSNVKNTGQQQASGVSKDNVPLSAHSDYIANNQP